MNFDDLINQVKGFIQGKGQLLGPETHPPINHAALKQLLAKKPVYDDEGQLTGGDHPATPAQIAFESSSFAHLLDKLAQDRQYLKPPLDVALPGKEEFYEDGSSQFISPTKDLFQRPAYGARVKFPTY